MPYIILMMTTAAAAAAGGGAQCLFPPLILWEREETPSAFIFFFLFFKYFEQLEISARLTHSAIRENDDCGCCCCEVSRLWRRQLMTTADVYVHCTLRRYSTVSHGWKRCHSRSNVCSYITFMLHIHHRVTSFFPSFLPSFLDGNIS